MDRIASKISQDSEAAIREDMTMDDALHTLDREVDAVLEQRRSLLRTGG